MRADSSPVMTWSIWLYELMLYATLFEKLLKQRGCRLLRAAKSLCELLTIVGLNALNLEFESLEHMLKKNSGNVSIHQWLYIDKTYVLRL